MESIEIERAATPPLTSNNWADEVEEEEEHGTLTPPIPGNTPPCTPSRTPSKAQLGVRGTGTPTANVQQRHTPADPVTPTAAARSGTPVSAIAQALPATKAPSPDESPGDGAAVAAVAGTAVAGTATDGQGNEAAVAHKHELAPAPSARSAPASASTTPRRVSYAAGGAAADDAADLKKSTSWVEDAKALCHVPVMTVVATLEIEAVHHSAPPTPSASRSAASEVTSPAVPDVAPGDTPDAGIPVAVEATQAVPVVAEEGQRESVADGQGADDSAGVAAAADAAAATAAGGAAAAREAATAEERSTFRASLRRDVVSVALDFQARLCSFIATWHAGYDERLSQVITSAATKSFGGRTVARSAALGDASDLEAELMSALRGVTDFSRPKVNALLQHLDATPQYITTAVQQAVTTYAARVAAQPPSTLPPVRCAPQTAASHNANQNSASAVAHSRGGDQQNAPQQARSGSSASTALSPSAPAWSGQLSSAASSSATPQGSGALASAPSGTGGMSTASSSSAPAPSASPRPPIVQRLGMHLTEYRALDPADDVSNMDHSRGGGGGRGRGRGRRGGGGGGYGDDGSRTSGESGGRGNRGGGGGRSSHQGGGGGGGGGHGGGVVEPRGGQHHHQAERSGSGPVGIIVPPRGNRGSGGGRGAAERDGSAGHAEQDGGAGSSRGGGGGGGVNKRVPKVKDGFQTYRPPTGRRGNGGPAEAPDPATAAGSGGADGPAGGGGGGRQAHHHQQRNEALGPPGLSTPDSIHHYLER